MLWIIGAVLVWLVSAAWIFSIMADVFRGKSSFLSPKVLPWYLFHGATAVLVIVMIYQAIA